MYNPISNKIEELSQSLGADDIVVKIAICSFISFPLNAIMKRLPDRNYNLKCWYILFISSLYLFGILNNFSCFRSLFISSMATYLISRFLSHSKLMPWINFLFVMTHLEINHITLTDDTSSYITTGAQMVLVMKLTSFAWSYYDGQQNSNASTAKTLTPYQKTKMIVRHPSPLEYLAYCFFYPSLLTGPSFDFVDFESWLHLEIFKDLPESKKPNKHWFGHQGKREIPKNGLLASRKIVESMIWLILFTYSDKFAPLAPVLANNGKDFIKSHCFIYRIFYLWLLGFTFRFKYYSAWTIAEASCILCGLGYNGYDAKTGKIKWNRVQNIDIKGFEFAQNTHVALEAWNQNTNKWLKYYVYLRVSKPGSKPGFRSTLITFVTSALWHGTKPGYYLTFITGAFYQTCGKLFRRNIRPVFMDKDGITPLMPRKRIYDLISYIVTQLAFGYMVQPFIVLNLNESLIIWSTVYYYIDIGIIVTLFLFKGPYSKKFIKLLRSHSLQYKQAKNSNTVINYSANMPISPDAINLGLPDLDETSVAEVKKDFNEFKKEYNEWREKKGLEIEEDNLQKAFEKFRDEIKGHNDKTEKRMSFSEYSPKPIKDD
ncbi:related to Lysophospholipid acyltransferase [Saccharomycodes ludwigii]|uniref:Related to Lysophospholipid acyltransferase n=1 Tax=Saccharomycodes ludwigii TaxID=36035 RepID=A0A376B736_9ASCO|nr:related to Lysophospholipid acyltransferase [Saccharomycodes ludwigii]